MAQTGVLGGPKIALFGALAGPLYLGYFKGLNGDSRVFGLNSLNIGVPGWLRTGVPEGSN